MSMMWVRMPGQTWAGATASFLSMWVAMMAAMMLPSLLPVLWRYRRASSSALTTVVASGYFFAWTAIGALVFALGVALASLEMNHASVARAATLLSDATLVFAALVQCSAWKTRHLDCWRRSSERGRASARTAWRYGLRLALECGRSSGNLMLVMLVVGIMDFGAMAAVTAAITLERIAPQVGG
jgi:predicted metal-binding membrane protein